MLEREHLLPLSRADYNEHSYNIAGANKNKKKNITFIRDVIYHLTKKTHIIKSVILVAIVTAMAIMLWIRVLSPSLSLSSQSPLQKPPSHDPYMRPNNHYGAGIGGNDFVDMNNTPPKLELIPSAIGVPNSNRITILEQTLQNVIVGNPFKENDSLDFLEIEAHSSTPGQRIVESRNFNTFAELIGSSVGGMVKSLKVATVVSACLLNNKAAIAVAHRLRKEGKLDLLSLSIRKGAEIFSKKDFFTNWMVIWRRLLSIAITLTMGDPSTESAELLRARKDDLLFFKESLPLLEEDVVEKQLSLLVLMYDGDQNQKTLLLSHIKRLPLTYEYNDLSKEIMLPFCDGRSGPNDEFGSFCKFLNK